MKQWVEMTRSIWRVCMKENLENGADRKAESQKLLGRRLNIK